MNLRYSMKIHPALKRFYFLIPLFSFTQIDAQVIEKIYKPYIATAQLYGFGNQQQLPIYTLNSKEPIQLEFDDLEGSLKSYYYTYVLCDYNWQPANLSTFDYIKGFTQNRITNYRYSSYALTRYTHYEAILPDANSLPVKSGNYLLKVFLNGDTSNLVFTKQMLVVDAKSMVTAQVVQPLSPQFFKTHQRLDLSVLLPKDMNAFSAIQQVKAVILQNNRWDNAQRDVMASFQRNNTLIYNMQNVGLFPAGKEWRWLDLRSFRLQSDRVDSAHYFKKSTDIFLKPDVDRTGQRYVYFPDYDGMYNIISYESINPHYQGDYATVNFRYAPPDAKPYFGQSLYLSAAFTEYKPDDRWKLHFNDTTGFYETSAYLKQGYYNYQYILQNDGNPSSQKTLEGDYWETENSYTILIYYKSFTDRNDQLIGISQVNSRRDRPGFSF